MNSTSDLQVLAKAAAGLTLITAERGDFGRELALTRAVELRQTVRHQPACLSPLLGHCPTRDLRQGRELSKADQLPHPRNNRSLRWTGCLVLLGPILGADRTPGADPGQSLNRRPVVDQMGQSHTTVCSTISASPSTCKVIGRPPGTIREDLGARVAMQLE